MKAEQRKAWAVVNHARTIEYGRKYRNANRDLLNRKAAERRAAFPERVKESVRKSKDRRRLHHRRLYRNIKSDVLSAYGGACVCCGESNPCFLTIDHAQNDGAKHRKVRKSDGGQYDGSGIGMYRWLKKMGYPKDGRFQLLCYNCNCCKQHDPVGHRLAHPNAVNIDGLGDLIGRT